MKIGIVQPYFFPYIGYFQLINTTDKFVIYDDVNFMKKKWINRNKILISGGSSFITVPLRRQSQNKLILETEIANDSKWKSKLLKSLRSGYARAPRFQTVYSLIEDVLSQNQTHISQLATDSLKAVCHYLCVETLFVDSSTIYRNAHLKSQDRILDICRQEGADSYLNPIGGTDLYSKKVFTANQICLNFVKPKAITYSQFGGEFVPFLSIIDVLMFNSKETVVKFLNQFELT